MLTAMPAPLRHDTRPDMSALPSAAVAFALGVAISRPVSQTPTGQFAALADELESRGEMGALLSVLDPELASRVTVYAMADRGQRWAHHNTSPR